MPKPRLPNLVPTPRLLKLLRLLKDGPQYGARLAELAPDMFFSTETLSKSGRLSAPRGATNVYILLRRAKNAGVIEEVSNYSVKAADDESQAIMDKRKYYTITLRGRELLKQTAQILE